MKITPKYDAVIHVPTHYSVEIYFSTKPNKTVVNQIERLGGQYGVTVKQDFTVKRGNPWVITFPPTYDPKEVAKEIESFLKADGWKNINVTMAVST